VPAEFRAVIVDMGRVAEGIVLKAGAIIAARDVDAARSIERDDDAMDELHRQLFSLLADPAWEHSTPVAVDLTLLGRYYERFADHAVSVARRVTFLVTGEYDTATDRQEDEDAAIVGAAQQP